MSAAYAHTIGAPPASRSSIAPSSTTAPAPSRWTAPDRREGHALRACPVRPDRLTDARLTRSSLVRWHLPDRPSAIRRLHRRRLRRARRRARVAAQRRDAGPHPARREQPGRRRERYASPPSYLAWVPGGSTTRASASAWRDAGVRRGGRRRRRHPLAGQDGATRRPGRATLPSRTRSRSTRLRSSRRITRRSSDASVRAEIVQALRNGRAVLGEHSARLRRLGPGGADLPNRVGPRRRGGAGRRRGVGRDARQPRGGASARDRPRALPAGAAAGAAHAAGDEARARPPRRRQPDPRRPPGWDPYVRVASGVRPPIVLKEYFGSSRRRRSQPRLLTIQPHGWIGTS